MSNIHDARVEKIYDHPEIIGLEDIIYRSMAEQFKQNNRLIYEPDLLMFDGNKYYIVEYKCSERGRNKAMKQLKTAELWFNQHYKDRFAEYLFVYGITFETEMI